MATNNKLKFFKVNGIASSDLTVGGIYFDKKTGIIHVATSATTTDKFGGNLQDALWNSANQTLTITKADGSNLTLNFADMASATTLSQFMASTEGEFAGVKSRLDVIEGESDGSIKAAVATEKSRAEGQEAAIRSEFAAADTTLGTTIRGEMAADKSDLQGKIDLKANSADVYTKTEADGLLNVKANAVDVYTKTDIDGKVTNINGLISAETAAREGDVENLQDQINSIVTNAITINAAEGDKYVEVNLNGTAYEVKSKGIDDAISTAVSGETALREAAVAGVKKDVDAVSATVTALIGLDVPAEGDTQKSIRTIANEELAKQLIPENATEALDELKEIAAWIQSHPGDASAMNAAIEANATNLAAEISRATAAEGKNASDIAALVEADAAQDTLIASKAAQADLDLTNGKVSALEGLVGNKSVDAQITAKIEALDANVDTAPATDDTLVAVHAVQTDGKLTSLTVDTKNIAKASELTSLTGRVATAESEIDGLQDKVGNSSVSDQIDNKIAALNADPTSTDGTNVQVKVTEVNGKITAVNITKDDTVSTQTHNDLAARVSANETAISNLQSDLCWVEFN
jgi:predicted nucleotidyltransferase